MNNSREYEINQEMDFAKIRDGATRVSIREAFVYYCTLRDMKASCELARLEESERENPSPSVIEVYRQREERLRISCKEIAYVFYTSFSVDFINTYDRA